MAIDINKIINESIQHTIDSVKEPVEMLTESENYHTPKQEYHYEGDSMSDFSPAIASAISAGLGALTFRNKLRSINEARQLSPGVKRAGKIAAGVGAAGLAGAEGTGAYLQARGLQKHIQGETPNQQLRAKDTYETGTGARLLSRLFGRNRDFHTDKEALRNADEFGPIRSGAKSVWDIMMRSR